MFFLLLLVGVALISIGLVWFCLPITEKLEKLETTKEAPDGTEAAGANLSLSEKF